MPILFEWLDAIWNFFILMQNEKQSAKIFFPLSGCTGNPWPGKQKKKDQQAQALTISQSFLEILYIVVRKKSLTMLRTLYTLNLGLVIFKINIITKVIINIIKILKIYYFIISRFWHTIYIIIRNYSFNL